VRGTAMKHGVRSETMARTSLLKYGSPRTIFRGKDEIFTKTNAFPLIFREPWKPLLKV